MPLKCITNIITFVKDDTPQMAGDSINLHL